MQQNINCSQTVIFILIVKYANLGQEIKHQQYWEDKQKAPHVYFSFYSLSSISARSHSSVLQILAVNFHTLSGYWKTWIFSTVLLHVPDTYN